MAAAAGSGLSERTVVHQFWHNADGSLELPLVVVASCKSVAASRNRRGILWSFQSFTNVPDGIEVRDAEELLSFEEFETYPRINLYADVLRIHAIQKYGGWWLDSDTIVWPGKELPSFTEGQRGFIGSCAPNPHGEDGLISAVFGVNEPGHPLMQSIIDRFDKISVEDRAELKHSSLQNVQAEAVTEEGYDSSLLESVVLQGNVVWWHPRLFRAMWTDRFAAQAPLTWGKSTLSSWEEVQQKSICVHLSNSRQDFDDSFFTKHNAKGPFGRLLWAVLDAKPGQNTLYVDPVVFWTRLDAEGFDVFPSIEAPPGRLSSETMPPMPSVETLRSKYTAFMQSTYMFKVNWIIAMTESRLEGHLNEWTWLPMQLATEAIRPLRVLEIGFNAGHSAAAIVRGLRKVWGNFNREWTYTAVDINRHAYTDPCFEVLRKSLGPLGSQLSKIWKPSTEALTGLIARKESYDMIHVDGCHMEPIARSDLEQAIELLPDGGWLRMDDMQYIGVIIATQEWAQNHSDRVQGPYNELCFKSDEAKKVADIIRHVWFYVLPKTAEGDDAGAKVDAGKDEEAGEEAEEAGDDPEE